MSSQQDTVGELITTLKQQRDELRLKMHLAEMEAREEYDRLSGKIDELADQYEPVSKAVGESADNVFNALKLAAEEMQAGVLRVWKAVQDQ